MALLVRQALVVGDRQPRIVEQLLQDSTQIAEDSLPQTDLHRLQIADASLGPLGFDQPNKSVGFPEPFLVSLGQEFFFGSVACSVWRVIRSVTVTNSSARLWNRL